MKKQILYLGKALNKVEQKQVNGGYIPTLYQFCCTRTQGFWLEAYPFLGNDPYYTCYDGICSNNGDR